MSRAALLPWASDPYLLNFWLRGFRRIWYGEVDKLYVYMTFPMEKDVADFARELCDDPKIHFIYQEGTVTHGVAIKTLLETATEEYILLIEDDAFVIRAGALGSCFSMLESGAYDIVGSPRGSCSFEILARGKELWGVADTGTGDSGCNFWPCFFFSKRQTLLDTDMQFDPQDWSSGDYIPELSWVAPCDLRGDTFVNTSIQLRAKNPKVMLVEQYHSYNNDPDSYQKGIYIFSGICPWFHVGSLSTGVNGVLMDNDNRKLTVRTTTPPNGETTLPPYPLQTEQERKEWQRRVAFWKTFGEQAPVDRLLEFRELYNQAVARVIRDYHLNEKEIQIRQTMFKKIMKGYYDQS